MTAFEKDGICWLEKITISARAWCGWINTLESLLGHNIEGHLFQSSNPFRRVPRIFSSIT